MLLWAFLAITTRLHALPDSLYSRIVSLPPLAP